MKTFFTKTILLLAAGLMAAGFISCDDTEEESGTTPYLKATPTELTFASAGETKTVAIEARNVAWAATTTDEWLTLADNSGSGAGTLRVTAVPNTTDQELKGTITVTGEGVDPVTIHITQHAATMPRSLRASVKALRFTCSDYYSKTIEVEADNVAWKATADQDWIVLREQHEADDEDGTVTVTMKKNPGAARTGTITLSAEGVEPVVIAVTQKELFASELIGTYVPYIEDLQNPIGKFIFTAEFTDAQNPPVLDLSFLMGGEGEFALPLSFVTAIAEPMVGMLYAGGLGSFTFRDDGTLAATYRTLESFDMDNGPVFSQQVYEYPDAETLEVMPADAIGYYTQDGKVYFTIDKMYLSAVGEMADLGDLISMIEGILKQYPDLEAAIVSTDEYYALPLKYEQVEGRTKLYADKELMLPFVPLITDLVETLAPTELPVEMEPGNPASAVTIPLQDLLKSLLDGLFVHTTSLEIGIELQKKA